MRKSYRFHSDRKLIVPRTDILDQKDRYLIVVEMPGLRKEDIHIELNGYKLVVKGKQTNKYSSSNKFYWLERQYGAFYREFLLPHQELNMEEIRTGLENGLLRIELMKIAYEERKIPV